MNAVSIIGLVFSGVMLLISAVTFAITNIRQSKTTVKEHEKELAELQSGIFKANMKLDQVCVTTNETRADIKAMNKTLAEHGEEIAVIKRDLKTAFIRIDEVREYVKSKDEREAKGN